MKYLLSAIGFALSVSTAVYGQEKAADTSSMIVALISEGTFGGKTIGTVCYPESDKYLDRGTVVLVGGIEKCSYSIYNPKSEELIIIFYNNEKYYVKAENLVTKDGALDRLRFMSTDESTAFLGKVQSMAEVLHVAKLKKAAAFLKSTAGKGVAILSWSYYDQSEYTSGTSVKIKIYNPTPKTIKYIWFTFTGYNAVGDRVVDGKRGSNITRQGIGPIKPDESGSYNYEYVWFSDLVETAKITALKVQYMDGSIKLIANPKEVILSRDLYGVLED